MTSQQRRRLVDKAQSPAKEAPQAAHRHLDVLLAGLGVREAQGVLAAAVHEERTAGHEGDFVLQRLIEQLPGVQTLGQPHEDEESAAGMVPAHLFRDL